MERIKKALGAYIERAVDPSPGEVLRARTSFITRDLVPLVRQLREFVNDRAPVGNVTLSGSTAYVDVTFATPERDALYEVMLSARDWVGSISYPALCLRTENRTTTGFRIQAASAPGGGKSLKVVWTLVR